MSKRLALIIGNSEYEDKNLAQLVTPDADVNALAEVLRNPEIGGFDEVVTFVNYSGAMIRREIGGFFTGRGRDDLLLLYFSGHGVRDDRGQLYLAVKDTEHNLLRGTAIPAVFITEEMDNSRSRRQVLILDCCHSGAFAHGMKGAPGGNVGTASAFAGTGSGRVVLTATDSTQYAWEGDQIIGQAENSVFTHYLIQGLRSGAADTDADGRITLDDLYDYVYEQVVNETPKQTPGKWSYGQQGEIIIARNPKPVLKLVELPADLQQTIDDPRPWVREGAVQELDRILRGSNLGLTLSAHEALKRLADDDSRRVATRATESLAAHSEGQHLREKTEQEASAGHSERVEQEPRAYERTGAERGAREEAEQKRLVREKAEPGWKGAQLTGMKTEQQVDTINSADALGVLRRSPVLLITIGLALVRAFGWVVSEAYGWQSTDAGNVWLILNAIGGLVTGLALKRAEPSIHWKQILLMTIGWLIGDVIQGGIREAMGAFSGTNLGEAIFGSVYGAIGGLSIGLTLGRTERSLHWNPILMIMVGWTMGMALSFFIGSTLYGSLDAAIGESIGLWAIPGAICGAISGFIGSVVMFWQLGQEHNA